MGKKHFLIVLLLLFISTSVSAFFQENYPGDNDPVAAPQLRENLNQLWQFSKRSFNPYSTSGTTVSYKGGKACFGNNVYTVPDGIIDFSNYTGASAHYVSIVTSGGTASLSVGSGSYNTAGIPLWNVLNASGVLTITDDRTWARNGGAGNTIDPATSGILKASSGVISAAVSGADYLLPTGDGSGLTGITASQVGAIPTLTQGVASGVATLNSGSFVVQNPADATSTATASKIPIADTNGKLDSWITNPTTTCLPLSGGMMTGAVKGGVQVTFGNVSGTTWNGYIPHSTVAFSLYSANQATRPYLSSTGDGSQLTGITALQVGAIPVSAEAAMPTPSAIPVADASGTLNSWITSPTTICLPLAGGTMTGPIKGNKQATFGNVTGTTWNGYIPHSSVAFSGYSSRHVGGGSGTVTSVSVTTANGFGGSILNANSTPAISITTNINGLLKGNGTAISAAVAGADYLTPTSNGSGLTGITASQVSMGNVTNDAQLKRSANDFSSFSRKTTPVSNDVLLIEDSTASGAKKYCTVGSLPGSGGNQTLDQTLSYGNKTAREITMGNMTGVNGYFSGNLTAFNNHTTAHSYAIKGADISNASTTAGVVGTSTYGTAVAGIGSTNYWGTGVYGYGTVGVLGVGDSAPGAGNTGVQGITYNGLGIQGIANGAYGFSGYFTGGLGLYSDHIRSGDLTNGYMVKAITNGQIANAIAGTDFLAPNSSGASLTGITKSQVGLGNVTNDAQLKRSSGDFSSFSQKTTPASNDVLLIEDSAASGAKKYITIGNLPSSSGTSGSLLNIQYLTSGTNATYTPTTGTHSIIIEMVGGGGGGGGASGSSSQAAAGGGGSSGAYLLKRITGFSGTATYTIGTYGAYGSSSGGSGGSGGNTSFVYNSITYTSDGGNGGIGMAHGTSVAIVNGGGPSFAVNGDINNYGHSGECGTRLSGTVAKGGSGGSGQFGGGGWGSITQGGNSNGYGFGSGGSGATSTSSTGYTGSNGQPGIIVVWEFS